MTFNLIQGDPIKNEDLKTIEFSQIHSSPNVSITLKIKSTQDNAFWGIRDFFVYYGTCSSPCSNCSNTPTFCTKCQNTALKVYKGTCLDKCPDFTFEIMEASIAVCKPCLEKCKTCVDSEGKCTSCDINLYLLQNDCVTDCGSGYFKSSGI